jgi:FkbM family methyltransferase
MSTSTLIVGQTQQTGAITRVARSVGYKLESGLLPSREKSFMLSTGDSFVYPVKSDIGRMLSLKMDPLHHSFLRQTLRPGDTFIDIGANRGLSTMIAARAVGGEGRVFAFEPSDRDADALQENLNRNRISNVGIFRKAVIDQAGRRPFALSKDSARNSFAKNTRASQEIENWFPVETTTFDRFMSRIDAKNLKLVNIDVEGAEGLVLNGAAYSLSGDAAPILMVHLHDEALRGLNATGGTIINKLETLGYQMYELTRYGGYTQRIALMLHQRSAVYHNTVLVAAKACHAIRPSA